MDWAGVAEIEILYDGAEGWRRIGGPVEQGGSSPTPADFTAAPRLAPAATAEWVYEQFGPGGAQALDLRDGVDWTTVGYRAPEVFSAGHIPYALPYDVRSWLDGGRWPTPRESWGRFLELGPREGTYLTPGTEIVLYGEGPETDQLGLAYLLLRHMGIDVRVFAGGWDEWTADPDRPVVRVASAAEVAEALGELVHREVGATAPMPFYDLREVRDHGRGYLPGSEVLPWPDFPSGLEASLEQTWSGIDRRMTPIVLYCYGRDCIRSWEASVVAARSGFLDIRWLREGVEGWDAAGLPLWVDEGASGAGSDP
ncbi:MAG: rhodanese-like domain-containing protein [Acidobacteriota bacterium]